MTETDFPHVMSPLNVGPLTFRNRIFVPAHTTNYGENHLPSERHLAYHRERARGGVGAIIFESIRIHLNSLGRPQAVQGFDPSCIELFRSITDAVKAEGACILGQVIHLGRQVEGDFERTVSWGASPIPWTGTALPPRPMDEYDMEAVIDGHVRSAKNLVEAGFDGIELQMAHGHLLQQFISPLSNKRDDRYGGSLENRLRFPIAVLLAVREAIGPDLCLGIRLSGSEYIDGGLEPAEAEQAALALAKASRVDFFNVSHAAYHGSYSLATQMADMGMDPEPFRDLPAGIRSTLREAGHEIPVFAVCRFTGLAEAESVIASGTADAVGMARAHLAEPAIVRKTIEGRVDEIRPCIACNQGCAGMLERNLPIRCLVNPRAGLEAEWDEPEISPGGRKRVLVVGAGAAGCEAAATLASFGHEATIWEASEGLGGQLAEAPRLARRNNFSKFLDYQARSLERYGITPEFGVRANADIIVELASKEAIDHILLATGAVETRPDLPGDGPIATQMEALDAPDRLGNNIAFWDQTGEWTALSLIEHLASQGRKVTVFTGPASIAWRTTIYSTLANFRRLRELGVRLRPLSRPVHWDGKNLSVEDLSCGEVTVTPFSGLVGATHRNADQSLYLELRKRGLPVTQIGDNNAPRTALEAVYHGHRAAREIAGAAA
ncbi:MAG: oxidoreductase [Rhizobiaceae bacterium MnEN-MB40S]|nr:MAG: oxidoreductase [Rhizobiaceae bacterium MnEN-MB40S]